MLQYGDVTYQYDDNGNTVKKTVGLQTFSYIYDVEDRLARVEQDTGGLIASYYYDPFGRRLWKEVDGTRTYFLYSDEGLIGEYDDSGRQIRSYGYAPDSDWTTDPLFYKSADTYYWYQNDHQGTPQKIIDTSGRTVWSAIYDSFGNCQIETAEVENNLRFAGQYFDQETGLYYNYNRYYDPKTGRYLRADPYGEGLNLYSYVFSNPVNFIDPLGLCAYKKISGWVHGGLAVLGLIPIAGIVPDLIDSGLYLLEGNLLDAGMASIAAIPIIGYGSRAVQWTAKFGKWVSKHLADIWNLAVKAKNIAKGLYRKIINKLSPKAPKKGFRDMMSPEEAARYDEYWQRYASDQVAPGTKRIDHSRESGRTGRTEESRVIYDEYGRQKYRVDKTDHMRPDDHSNPHLHERDYHPTPHDPHYTETRYNF